MKREIPRIVLYGASGHAANIRLELLNSLAPFPLFEVAAFIDDFRGDQGLLLDRVPIVTLEMWRLQYPDVPCFITIGDPVARRRLAEKVEAAGGTFVSVFHKTKTTWPRHVGEGSFVGNRVSLGREVSIGRHVHVMAMTVIGHDCELGDFVTVCPSANISGYVIVEEGAFIGVGAIIVNGSAARPLRIGSGAVISAGSVVTKSVKPGEKVAGNPARNIRDLARFELLLGTD